MPVLEGPIERVPIADEWMGTSAKIDGPQRFVIDIDPADLVDAAATAAIVVECAEDSPDAADDDLSWRHVAGMEWRGGPVAEGRDGIPGIGTSCPPGTRSRVRLVVGKQISVAVGRA